MKFLPGKTGIGEEIQINGDENEKLKISVVISIVADIEPLIFLPILSRLTQIFSFTFLFSREKCRARERKLGHEDLEQSVDIFDGVFIVLDQ